MPRFSYHAVIQDDAGSSGTVFQEHKFSRAVDIHAGDVIEGEHGHLWYVQRVEDLGPTGWKEEPSSVVPSRKLVCRLLVDEPPAA